MTATAATTTTQDPAAKPAAPGAWSPLKRPVFRALWIATLISNIGTWMHDVGAAWMMTTLSPSPLMVALVQAATTLPVFLLALPSGVLADIFDRRTFLLWAQIFGTVATAGLALAALFGMVTPAVLLVFTFLIGISAAASAPAFQAIVPELVPKEELPPAVALNSLSINVSRAIGPALGGLIVAASGPAAVFALNALSFLAVIAVVWAWKREAKPSRLPREHFLGAMRTGLRYVREAPDFRRVLVRALGFFLFASAVWALLPVVARDRLGLDATGYGVLLAVLGAGAVTGALVLPTLRRSVSNNTLSIAATVLFAGVAATLALARDPLLAGAALAVAGACWITVLSSFHVAAQTALPGWVKARGLSVFLVVFFGSMSAGSALWGWTAGSMGLPAALLAAAAGQLLGLLVAPWNPLRPADAGDHAPSAHWPQPLVHAEPDLDRGPVLVTVEYAVPTVNTAPWLALMAALKRSRLRGGALTWAVYEDAARPGRWLETFVTESWVEHLRQHDRVTQADKALQERVRALCDPGSTPRVDHFLGPAATPDGVPPKPDTAGKAGP